jgi:hypothetical protein
MQYNQTSTVGMDKKIEFLSEKIDDSWFKNAEIDYGIIGGLERLSYEKEADVLLVVTREENGFELLQTIAITHASDYNAEQLYDIWSEQYSALDMMMFREPEMQYQNKQMTCFESSEKIWQWNDLNITQSELENQAKHAAENYWYDKLDGNTRSPMSEFYSDFGHDTHTDDAMAEAVIAEYMEVYRKHRSDPEVYMNYIEDLPIMNDLWEMIQRGNTISEKIKKEAVSDVSVYLNFVTLDVNPEKIVEDILVEWKEIQDKCLESIKEDIINFHNTPNPCPKEKENIIGDICRAKLLEIPDAAKFLENELAKLEVNDIATEVFVGLHNKTIEDYQYSEACRDIAELYNLSFDVGTKFLEQALEHKKLEIENEKILVGNKELDYLQKFKVLVEKQPLKLDRVTLKNRTYSAIINADKGGKVRIVYNPSIIKRQSVLQKKDDKPTVKNGVRQRL